MTGILFIGGTALARTHLPDGRLSEHIDLIALGDRKQVARDLDATLPRAVARSHGRLTVEPELRGTTDTLPVLRRPADGPPGRLQLLSSRDRILWPTERRPLVQRYSDAPAAELLVPTLSAFAASKTARRMAPAILTGRPTSSERSPLITDGFPTRLGASFGGRRFCGMYVEARRGFDVDHPHGELLPRGDVYEDRERPIGALFLSDLGIAGQVEAPARQLGQLIEMRAPDGTGRTK